MCEQFMGQEVARQVSNVQRYLELLKSQLIKAE
jgi:hypothetical protein